MNRKTEEPIKKKQTAMKFCINNKANYQDYREFQEVSKDQLREHLDNILNKYEKIHSLSIAIEFKDDHKINEYRKAQELLKPEDRDKLINQR